MVNIVNGHNRPDGAEAFLSYHAIFEILGQDNGRLNEQLIFIHGSTKNNLASRRIYHLLEPMEAALVDDATEIGTLLGAIRHKCLEITVELSDELGHDAALHQRVILRETDLASVYTLGPEKSPGSHLDVGILRDESRIPATQLEKRGRQGLGSLFGDNGPHSPPAGEDNLVVLLLEESLRYGESAVDALVALGIQGLVENLLENHGRGLGVLRRLEENGVAGGDGANGRDQIQLDRVVEGTNDEDDAQGLVANAVLHGPEGDGEAYDGLVLAPLLEVLDHVENLRLDPVELSQNDIVLALAQILHERGLEERRIVLDSPVQLAQLNETELDVLGAQAHVSRAQRLDGAGDLVDGRRLERWDGGRHDGLGVVCCVYAPWFDFLTWW